MSTYEISAKILKKDGLTVQSTADGNLETIRATVEEALAGTDTNKAMTPATTDALISDRMVSSVKYRGMWTITPETTDYSGLNEYRPIAKASLFRIGGEGPATIDGVVYNPSDSIIFNADVGAEETITTAKIDHYDHTDRWDTVYLNVEQELTNKTIDTGINSESGERKNTILNLDAANLKSGAVNKLATEELDEVSFPSTKKVESMISVAAPGVDDITVELFDNTSAGGSDHDIRVKAGDDTNGLTVAHLNNNAVELGATEEKSATTKLPTLTKVNEIVRDNAPGVDDSTIELYESGAETGAKYNVRVKDEGIVAAKINTNVFDLATDETKGTTTKLTTTAKVEELIDTTAAQVDNVTVETFDNTEAGGSDHDIRVKDEGITVGKINASVITLANNEAKSDSTTVPSLLKVEELITDNAPGVDDETIELYESGAEEGAKYNVRVKDEGITVGKINANVIDLATDETKGTATKVPSVSKVEEMIDTTSVHADNVTIEVFDNTEAGGSDHDIRVKDEGITTAKLNVNVISLATNEAKADTTKVTSEAKVAELIRDNAPGVDDETIELYESEAETGAKYNARVKDEGITVEKINASVLTLGATEEKSESTTVPTLTKVGEMISAAAPGVDDETIELFDNTEAGGSDHDVRVKDEGLKIEKLNTSVLSMATDETKGTTTTVTTLSKVNELIANATPGVDDNTIEVFDNTEAGGSDHDIRVKEGGADNGLTVAHLKDSAIVLAENETKSASVELVSKLKAQDMITNAGDTVSITSNTSGALKSIGFENLNPEADENQKFLHYWYGTTEQYRTQKVYEHEDWIAAINDDQLDTLQFMSNVYHVTKVFEVEGDNHIDFVEPCRVKNYITVFQDRVFVKPDEYELDDTSLGITFNEPIAVGSEVLVMYFQGLPAEEAALVINSAEELLKSLEHCGNDSTPIYIDENKHFQTISSYSGNAATATLAARATADEDGNNIIATYATKSEIAGAFHVRGSVATVEDLPASGNNVGDCRNVNSTGANYVWVGDEEDAGGQMIPAHWDELSGLVDLEPYATKAAVTTSLALKEDLLTGDNAGDGIAITRDETTGKVTIANTNRSATFANLTGEVSDNAKLVEAFGEKQDVLTAGTGIKIEDNVVSLSNPSVAFSAITGNATDNASLANALSEKAPLASPALTGTPTAPTASASTENTQIATTEYVANKFQVVAELPTTLVPGTFYFVKE